MPASYGYEAVVHSRPLAHVARTQFCASPMNDYMIYKTRRVNYKVVSCLTSLLMDRVWHTIPVYKTYSSLTTFHAKQEHPHTPLKPMQHVLYMDFPNFV